MTREFVTISNFLSLKYSLKSLQLSLEKNSIKPYKNLDLHPEQNTSQKVHRKGETRKVLEVLFVTRNFVTRLYVNRESSSSSP